MKIYRIYDEKGNSVLGGIKADRIIHHHKDPRVIKFEIDQENFTIPVTVAYVNLGSGYSVRQDTGA